MSEYCPKTKKCKKCLIEKSVNEFYTDRTTKDGLRGKCRPCLLQDNHIRKSSYGREVHLARARLYNSRPEVKEAKHRDYLKNRNKRKQVLKERRESGFCVGHKKRKSVIKGLCEVCAFKNRIRCLIRSSFRVHGNKVGLKKPKKTEQLLGCDIGQFKLHIERQFKDGMSWENMSEWHIDHKIPLVSAKTSDELLSLCHYSNLQPLWAIDNIKKGGKL